MSKTVGVVIDSWKLDIFKKNLDEAGYSYTENPGLTKDTLILRVSCDLVAPLQKVIEKCQIECRK